MARCATLVDDCGGVGAASSMVPFADSRSTPCACKSRNASRSCDTDMLASPNCVCSSSIVMLCFCA